jgi:hypothetical protein
MSLVKTESHVVRESQGFSFVMRVGGTDQTVRIFVSEDALKGDDETPSGKDLLAQIVADREALEAIACEKYAHGRVTSNGVINITVADVIGFIG